MKLEDLIKEGLSEELANKVMDLYKKSIDGNYVPKATFDAEREKVKNANDTIADRDKQIAELGEFKGTAEELQKKVDDLTAENTKKDQEYQDKIKEMEETAAIRTAVSDIVYSADDIMPKLDRTKLTIKDGRVVAGLVEQMETIKQASPHYFKETKDSEGNTVKIPNGWQLFGRSPEEGKGQGGTDSAAEFGKSLAKAQSQGIASTQKAADIYFK